jgi:hypothetical protein
LDVLIIDYLSLFFVFFVKTGREYEIFRGGLLTGGPVNSVIIAKKLIRNSLFILL